MRVKVEKVSGNKNTFRTPIPKIDSMDKRPVVGECLYLKSSTFESGGIFTSKVSKVEETKDEEGKEVLLVHTDNSIYKIEILNKLDQ